VVNILTISLLASFLTLADFQMEFFRPPFAPGTFETRNLPSFQKTEVLAVSTFCP
jgi:hypothetical protein